MAVYAVSDLHGYLDVFLRGLKEIEFGDDDELYVVGDAIDRGPDGIALLQYIKEHENMDLLIGNHEDMMLGYVHPDGLPEHRAYVGDSDIWLHAQNGGEETFSRYLELTDDERRGLLTWLNGRKLIKIVQVGDRQFCLVHSYYREDAEGKAYSELDMKTVFEIVNRSIFGEGAEGGSDFIFRANPQYTFITGHRPVQYVRRKIDQDPDYNRLEPYVFDNFYNIDGWCAYGPDERGELQNGAIFLRLDDLKAFPVRL